MKVKTLFVAFLLFAVGGVTICCLFGFVAKQTAVKQETATHPKLPAKIDFCGEPAPLDRWDVRERLDRELLFNYYNTPNVLYSLKLAGRYFPIIAERLKANGVPEDFKYLCLAESNLVTAAVSRSGAVSFWQFLDKTAPDYHLIVNKEIDQRYDVEKSTDAACKYLKQAYAKFGNWTAAAASYNCGQTGYTKQSDFQRTKNYYDLFLPEETNRYVFRILTFKYLIENAESLGFRLDEDEKYRAVPYETVEITGTIPDLAVFAMSQGTNYKVLQLMNPWIRGQSLTVTGNNKYVLKIPIRQRR